MNNVNAQKSSEISLSIKNALIRRSLYINENSLLYLEINNIPVDGNGKIVSSYTGVDSGFKHIEFTSFDTIQASRKLNKKTGVLVSCSHRRAGGGWLSGSMAQEENISRATTWAFQANNDKFKSWYLNNQWYGQNGSLVIDGLLLFNEQWQELSEPKRVVFAGVAAANKSSLNDNDYWDSKIGYAIRKKHLINNLSCAFEELKNRDVEVVVLCAFGTNVFGWKLEESIQVLHEATKYAPKGMSFVCAMGDENKCDIAKDIYKTMKI